MYVDTVGWVIMAATLLFLSFVLLHSIDTVRTGLTEL